MGLRSWFFSRPDKTSRLETKLEKKYGRRRTRHLMSPGGEKDLLRLEGVKPYRSRRRLRVKL